MNNFVRQQYNKIAKNYLAGRDRFKNNKYLEELSKYLEPNSTILDVGCGAGVPVDDWLISKGHKIIGIDISEKQIELARKIVPDGMYERKDMSELVDGEYKVDAVVSFYAIFHTPREGHIEILKKINSFLIKDGLLLISMGSDDWVGKEPFFGDEMSWSHYGKEENINLVKDAGFEIILSEIDTTGGENHLFILAKKK